MYEDGDAEWIGVDEVVEIILPPDDDEATVDPVSLHVTRLSLVILLHFITSFVFTLIDFANNRQCNGCQI